MFYIHVFEDTCSNVGGVHVQHTCFVTTQQIYMISRRISIVSQRIPRSTWNRIVFRLFRIVLLIFYLFISISFHSLFVYFLPTLLLYFYICLSLTHSLALLFSLSSSPNLSVAVTSTLSLTLSFYTYLYLTSFQFPELLL